jgi:thiamine biosynthesis lipoprotein
MDAGRAMTRTPVALGDARFFAHEAMKTTFTLRFADMGEEDAKGVTRECFELVDRLENALSRYCEGSEVWRINHLRAGETLYLSDACHRCLLKALEGWQATGGLFDITQGRRIEHRKSALDGPVPEICGSLIVHPDVPAITCVEEGRELDLGGIGKGFALDEMAALLADWEIGNVLLAAGGSSLLAAGDAVWPVELAGDGGVMKMELSNEALSASGTGIQGAHIVHPGAPGGAPNYGCKRVWVVAPSAAAAEVWSTAVMLVPAGDLEGWLAEGGDYRRVLVEEKEGMRTVFPMPEGDAR